MPNITIKRKNGASIDVLYPYTIISQVSGLQSALDAKIATSQKGAASGIATLDADAKIPISQLPDSIFDGLEFVGTIDTATKNLSELFPVYTADDFDSNRSLIGNYYIVNIATTVSADAVSGMTWHLLNNDDGLANTGFPITLDVHDWIALSKLTGDNVSGYDAYISIINNTQSAASTVTYGTTKLSSSTSTATTGSNVITDGILNGLLGGASTQTANKLAPSVHDHDSTYLGISANAVSASKWAASKTITLAGDATGSVSIDGSSNVTLTVAVVDDSHNHIISNVDGLQTALDAKVAANTAITGATKAKITYDSKGLVTAGVDLTASDIPALGASKITSETFDIARIPTGTTSTTVSLGNHTHTFASLTSIPSTLAGYGITESDTLFANRPEIYYADDATLLTLTNNDIVFEY